MSLSSWINYQYITPLIYYINEISCRDDEELQALSLVNIIWGKTLLPVILLIHYNLANKWIQYDVYTGRSSWLRRFPSPNNNDAVHLHHIHFSPITLIITHFLMSYKCKISHPS